MYIHTDIELALCFVSSLQCNEPRTEDAPSAEISLSNSTALGKKGLEAG